MEHEHMAVRVDGDTGGFAHLNTSREPGPGPAVGANRC